MANTYCHNGDMTALIDHVKGIIRECPMGWKGLTETEDCLIHDIPVITIKTEDGDRVWDDGEINVIVSDETEAIRLSATYIAIELTTK